ncbi:MAG: cytochrome c3 family protein [Chlamydiota bacterium]
MRTAKALGLVVLVVALTTTMGFAKAPKSAIVNSAHDLRATMGTGSYTLCNFCHIAHKFADVTAPATAGPLLWNHTLSSVTSYGVYTSDTFAGYATDITDLGTVATPTVSNLCLSCHDGTVAVDSWYSAVRATQNAVNMPLDRTVKDLTQQHPINFTYNAALANAAGILVPASTTSVDGAGEIPLFAGKMQCATCHDPHNGASGILTQQFPTQTSGTFCTYCHL